MRIAFVYAGGRQNRLAQVGAGEAPSEFFYGAVELARGGHSVEVFDLHERERSLAATAYNVLLSGATPVRTRGEHLLSTAGMLERLRKFDVVVATSTSHANALGIWKRLGRLRPRLAGIHCGLVNFPTEGVRARTTRWTLEAQQCVLFADSEREEMIRRFALAPGAVHANAFGVDTEFWTPGEAVREWVLSVGNDARRDYATLVGALEGVDMPAKIVTSRWLPDRLPDRVEHLKGTWQRPAVTDQELRDLYRRACVVVVPLIDSLQPSGQSVALQAMACGAPVILSRTRGLWTGEDFVDGEHLMLVDAGNAGALRDGIRRVAGDAGLQAAFGAAARARVCERGNIRDFARRLEAVCAG